MNEVQKKIEALRQKGWSVAAIADGLGTTVDAVRKWKAGRRQPSNAKGIFELLDGLLQDGNPPPKRRRHSKQQPNDGNQSTTERPLEVVAGTSDRPLIIHDIEIPCYVLEDETRVLSQRGVTAAIGLNPDAGFRMPDFVAIRALRSFVDNQLGPAVNNPIHFKNPSGGGTVFGYPAPLLVQICSAVLSARDAGLLPQQHDQIAHRCDILVRGLAIVGIIGLIDEATGYQEIRARRSLAAILERFISQELQPWTRTFPYEFYEQIFRLKGWPGPDGVKRPSVIGHYTNEFVYDRLAPGLLSELRALNPTDINGVRRHRHHQWFTPALGHPKLREHLAAVTALMRAASNWTAFERSMDRAFPKLNG